MPAIRYFENQLILPFWAHFLVPISLNEAEQWPRQANPDLKWNEQTQWDKKLEPSSQILLFSDFLPIQNYFACRVNDKLTTIPLEVDDAWWAV